jgi:iron(III) transport system permease protein
MRRATLPIELLLLAFLGLFLLYPLAYILPGAASDEEFHVVLVYPPPTGRLPEKLRQVLGWDDKQPELYPAVLKTFPATQRKEAEQFAKKLDSERFFGSVIFVGEYQVVPVRNWTTFYFKQALGCSVESSSSFPYFTLTPTSPTTWEYLRNSLLLAIATTVGTTVLTIPLAKWFTRYRFRGQGLLSGLLLVPLIVPPFVGAIGMERLLHRFGTVNLVLMNLGILDPGKPIDWLAGGGFFGVVLMQVLHLYPILYLNLAAAWANIDPTLEDAARNLGASEWRVFRTVTFPLLLPGFFAGATLVFVAAFTDLGTPLVFNYLKVIPVRIFFEVSDPQRTNAVAYALVVITLIMTAVLFYSARWLVSRRSYSGVGKGAVSAAVPQASGGRTVLIYSAVILLTLVSMVPNVGVALTAFAQRWSFTPLPESYTTAYLGEVWSNPIAASSIRNSIYFSTVSTVLDVILGGTIAWLVARRPSVLTGLLEGLAMLPLALPGLILAFGYLTCYSGWAPFLDPAQSPVLLLIIAYSVRRLPFMTRSALAGLQQISPVLEEAAENLGASRFRVLRTVTFPLIAANLVAGAILTFAFALLEVSDSLMLAREEKYYPITRAILGLLMRPDDGDNIACAMGVLAMGLLAVSLLVASLALGRKMGELFRA